ncbi:aspartate semialdehyde dehydrogenase [Bellilinea caldifistulae]|uniref:Aspartate-semialdehyde dehydrogenase n=1 Tax=Bellilinea caldifistulae TaxID=360411 RepID=A0A0P6XKT6_9CHLR|nr:aspartate-semialdehyde dehydrogenase [Bellilinea caldifistulae]KPL76733.1 aspartate-semialdehyde dehydrogenase [Bellilinea caldifistulae]GAP08930.1 aspartate semialdehyde dehydrogenase [Bellilinea caldifistulae]
MSKIPVAVLAATGSVGQRFVQLLDNHPWFEVVALTGSERGHGKTYGEVCRWLLPEPMPDWARMMPVLPSEAESLNGARLAFSALPADIARQVEPALAQAGIGVCSNASAYRREPDVPLLIPEVNPEHARLVEVQRRRRGWTGWITTNPNCTSTGMTIALKALQDAFGLKRVFAVSLQALSGAGYPGVASLDIADNVIPFISGEEDKVEWEPRKMLGKLEGEEIRLAEFGISAHTNRVAVTDGHLVCLSVELAGRAAPEQAAAVLAEYEAPAPVADLPSVARPVIVVREEENRPQPRLDRMTGRGMTTVVGRVRPDALFDLRLTVLSHNTIRGAAGGSLLNAELMVRLGYVS